MTLDIDRSTWTRVRLGDVARQVKTKVDPTSGEVDRYVAGEHMDTDELRITRWGTVGDGYLGPAFHIRFKPGQVLYGSRRTYLRKVALADFDGVCANTTFVIETRDPNVLLPDLLPFVLSTERFHEHSKNESKGSVNPYVNWPDIAKYEFDLPPLDDQRRISRLLWSIADHRQSVAGLRDALRGATALALGRRLGQLSCDGRKLGDVLDLCQYGLSTRANEVGSYACLRMTNMQDGRVRLDDLTFVELSDDEVTNFRLQPGDVLFNRTNSYENVGRSALFNNDDGVYVFASYLVRLRPGKLLLPQYLNLFINSAVGQARIRTHVSRGVSQANVSASKLQSVNVPIPSIAVQQSLVSEDDRAWEADRAFARELAALAAVREEALASTLGGAG